MRRVDLKNPISLTEDLNTWASWAPSFELPAIVPRARNPVLWPVEDGYLDYMLGSQQRDGKSIKENKKPKPWNFTDQVRYSTKTTKWATQKTKTKTSGLEKGFEDMMYSSRAQVWIPRRKKGFYLGGVPVKGNIALDLSKPAPKYMGMFVYDGETKTWTNETGPHNKLENPHMVHLPAGDDDLLIALGGPGTTVAGNEEEFRMVCVSIPNPPRIIGALLTRKRQLDMRTINIYSVNNRKWYKHVIPSEEKNPGERSAFCTAIFSASDNSSHQIYLIGGASPNEKDVRTITSIWALSLPSMQWIDLPLFPTVRGEFEPGGRVSSVCVTAGAYVLVSGGRRVNGIMETPICDDETRNIWTFNPSALKWDSQYDPKLKYSVPNPVSEVIGGK